MNRFAEHQSLVLKKFGEGLSQTEEFELAVLRAELDVLEMYRWQR